ncbi:hypothetical protein IF2G_03988 [Cordyceps javanica]|nr:hypothetical protein IF2G_03988 [Cordyceps javanica]
MAARLCPTPHRRLRSITTFANHPARPRTPWTQRSQRQDSTRPSQKLTLRSRHALLPATVHWSPFSLSLPKRSATIRPSRNLSGRCCFRCRPVVPLGSFICSSICGAFSNMYPDHVPLSDLDRLRSCDGHAFLNLPAWPELGYPLWWTGA